MAIAFDAYTNLGSGTSPRTVSYTTGTGNDRLLVVLTIADNGNTVTGVTYNGVAMTDSGASLSDDGSRSYLIWYLVAPATGANNVVMTFTGGGNAEGHAASYTGVIQSSPIDATGSATGLTNTPRSINITSTVDSTWGVGGYRDQDGTPTDGSMTIRTSNSLGYMDSNGDFGTSGTEVISFTGFDNSQPGYIIAALIKPSIAVGPSTLKTYDTVAAASVKTINGVAIASVKTINTAA